MLGKNQKKGKHEKIDYLRELQGIKKLLHKLHWNAEMLCIKTITITHLLEKLIRNDVTGDTIFYQSTFKKECSFKVSETHLL